MSYQKLNKKELIAHIENLEKENLELRKELSELRGFKQGIEYHERLKDFLSPQKEYVPYPPLQPTRTYPTTYPEVDRWSPWVD